MKKSLIVLCFVGALSLFAHSENLSNNKVQDLTTSNPSWTKLCSLRLGFQSPEDIKLQEEIIADLQSQNYPGVHSWKLRVLSPIPMNILESWNLKQSQAGDICATFNLAMHYQYYQSLNMKESFKLLNQAADAGLAEAEYWLGNAYYLGEKGILEKDPKKAAQLWSNAASKGFPDAIYKVANMHRLGEIYPKNLKIAKDLFLQCDKYGNPLCAYWYARMLLEDDKPDVKEALKYLEKITQTSIVYGEAQLTIGKILIDTTNIEEFNLTGGIKSLRSATLLANNAEAALILSKIYYDNRLISIDLTESYRWLCAYQKIKQDVGIEFEIPEDVFAMKSHIEISIGSDAAEKIKTDAITILKK